MPGFRMFREALERHREQKDVAIKYKTPLTSKLINAALSNSPVPTPLFVRLPSSLNILHTIVIFKAPSTPVHDLT
jgi:hypothetical protein